MVGMVLALVLGTACATRLRRGADDRAPRIAGRPEFVLQARDTRSSGSATFSPDGRLVASAGYTSVLIWDVETGTLRASLQQEGRVGKVAWSPDGESIASGNDGNGKIHIWDARTGRLLRALERDNDSGPIAWAPDGRCLAERGNLWDPRSGAFLLRLKAEGRVWALAFSPDGALLALALGNSVQLFDRATGAVRAALEHAPELTSEEHHRVLTEHSNNIDDERNIEAVAWSPDGARLATAGQNGILKVWDVRSGRLEATFPQQERGFESIAWSPDGSLIASIDSSGISLWGAATARLIVRQQRSSGFASIGWNRSGTTLLVADFNGAVEIWKPHPLGLASALGGAARASGSVAISPDGSTLAVASYLGKVKIWDLRAGAFRALVDFGNYSGGIAFGPDGQTIASVGESGLQLRDALTGLLRANLKPASGRFFGSFAWSADGSRVAVTAGNVIELWDVRAGQRLRDLPGYHVSGNPVALSPDARLLATRLRRADAERIVLFDTATGLERLTFPGPGATALAFHPAGAMLAAASKGEVRLLDPASGTTLRKLDCKDCNHLAFAADGSVLVTAGWNQPAQLWDVATGSLRVTLRSRIKGGLITSVAVSRDGRTVAIAQDGTRLHRLSDGKHLWLRSVETGGREVELTHTEEGVFDGDDLASEKILFRIGDDLRTADMLSAEQLFEAFHHPNLLADFMQDRSIDPRAQSQEGVGLPPSVELLAAPPPEVDSERVTVRVRANDRGGGVSEVRVFLNGTRADGGRGIRMKGVPSPLGAEGERPVELVLTPGDNEIVAEAYGAIGRVRSRRARHHVLLRAAPIARPDLHLLVVTLDEYEDPSQRLSFANADGDAVVEAFRGQAGKLYGAVNVMRLRDAEATREGIEQAALRLAKVARTSDVFIFYSAGHGRMARCQGNDDRYHLLTYRASLRNDRSICEKGMADSDLATLVRAIPVRKKLLILDTCQAGAAASEKMLVAMRGAQEVDAIKRLARAEGVAVVAAAQATEYAGEVAELKHGIFTHALLQGLRGRASSGLAGPVSVFSLLSFLQTEVATLSERYFRRPQYPITSTQGQDFPIYLP